MQQRRQVFRARSSGSRFTAAISSFSPIQKKLGIARILRVVQLEDDGWGVQTPRSLAHRRPCISRPNGQNARIEAVVTASVASLGSGAYVAWDGNDS